MARELSAIRPERRANQDDAAVVTEDEFDRRMSRYVADQLRAVPEQEEFRLNRQALDAFVQMRDAARADGVELVIGASYRSPERARANAGRNRNRVAVADFSSHTLGLAIDFNLSHGTQQYQETTTRPMQNVVDMRQSPAHKWLFLRGAAYGWYPYQNEPWHWEYNPPGFREQFRDQLNPE
jgi:LAS superfamily LD-carboxypeptidase LdcB